MGNTQSTTEKHGYTAVKGGGGVYTSTEGDQVVILKVPIPQQPNTSSQKLDSEIETLKNTCHPHIVSYKNSFQDNSHYIVMDYCHGGDLAQKIKKQKDSGQEFGEDQILTWIVQICMALKYIHENELPYKDLTPQTIFLTQFGTACLDRFGKLRKSISTKSSLHYAAPELLKNGVHDNKGDVWAMGCVLYELCTLRIAFTADDTPRLKRKILDGPYPSLPEHFSEELCDLLEDIFKSDPHCRPTAREILGRPFMISFLSRKSKAMVEELQVTLGKLRALADGLESMHQGTTIGSLTGGVIGVLGGITTIVGLILSPFTLGASLIVTGVGIGVSVAGGATAGVSNVTNMINQSNDRQAIRGIIKEISEKMNSVVASLQDISEGLEKLRQNVDSHDLGEGRFNADSLRQLGLRAGRGLGGITELARLVQVMNVGKVAAQAARAVRVAEVATGVFSVFFVAIDVFFIAMDAKEIHHIRRAKATEAEATGETSTSRLELMESEADSQPETEAGSETEADSETGRVMSETMRFVGSIRQTVQKLQEIVNELCEVTALIP